MSHVVKRIIRISVTLLLLLAAAMMLGLLWGSSGRRIGSIADVVRQMGDPDSLVYTIIWGVRFPRVLTAALVGAALSLAGLVFQALLRNPLAEPYILGISGGAAIGAIAGILLNLSRFFGVGLFAFLGGMSTLLLVLFISGNRSIIRKESILLSGVMINAFCAAVIMFLISLTQDARIHSIMFWLMGDLSSAGGKEAVLLALGVVPCFVLIFWKSNPMNLLLMGREMAQSLGVNVKALTVLLLILASFMVSATVCYCGLIGFVGLVIPHLFRLILGPDHRVMVPACIFGGGAYLVLCDLLARTLPRQGEMPAGVITAMIGAPVFIFLLKRFGR